MSEDDQADPKVGHPRRGAEAGRREGRRRHRPPQLRRHHPRLGDLRASAGIPVISGSATNPALTERGLKGVFRTVGRDDQQGPAIASFIAE